MSFSSPIGYCLLWRVLPVLLLSLSLGLSQLQHAVAGQKVPNSEVKVIQKLIFERKMAEAAPRLDTAMANYPDSGRLAFLLGQLYYSRFQIISATFMERCRRGSRLLKVVRSSRQRNKQ
ncbi:MAG: hypothetical protein JG763_3383, partial [Shewanella sp.]|uniref:hypothetical protein n=1 Tax=Shewanella sp. TaxID=50422 RepID=UPI001EC85FDD